MGSFPHQPGAVVARKVLLTYLNKAPESLLWDTITSKQVSSNRLPTHYGIITAGI